MSKITLNGVDYAGGGLGGHTIYDKYGNALARESGLQFTGNVNVSDDNINGRTVVDILGGTNMHHYSTSEQVVGTWINNKPLYEITIEADNPTAYVIGSRKYIEVPYNISVIDFAKCVNCTIYDSTDGRWYSLPYQRITSSENIDVMEMSKSDGSYVITAHWATSNAYNITKVRYTIQYTKTTD